MEGQVTYNNKPILRGILTAEGGEPVIEEKNIIENGTYTAPEGVDGYNPINVNVPIPTPVIEPLNATIGVNGTTVYDAPTGVDGFDPVTINVEVPEPNLITLTAAENGSYTPGAGVDGYDEVIVNVPEANLISLTANENGTYTPGVGVDGYDEVIVNVSSLHYYCKNLELVSHTGQFLGDRTLDNSLTLGRRYLCIGYREADTVPIFAGILNLTSFNNNYEIARNIQIYIRDASTISSTYASSAGFAISIMDIPDGLDQNPFV